MSFYLIDDIQQGSDDWHRWRRGVIGASEAAIIMGENRWKGRQQLLDEKRGLRQAFTGNDATREGQLLEDPARAALQELFNVKLRPTIAQDASEPFLAASLDAINSSYDKAFEIKCGHRTYEAVSATKRVPSHYVAQVQHQLMVTQMEKLIFAAYRPNQSIITLEVHRNDRFIKELRRKEKDFINELERLGHEVQREFRGSLMPSRVGKGKKTPRKNREKPTFEWRMDGGNLRFWDGQDYLEGDGPGFYRLGDEFHYWSGDAWFVPIIAGDYSLDSDIYYWTGEAWDGDFL